MKVATSGKLHIKKRPLPQWLTLFIFVMPFFLATLQDIFRMPPLVKYTIDVAWVLAISILFLRKKLTLDRKLIPFLIYIGVFLLYTIVFYILNFQSPIYFLWGFRNNFRFYFAFVLFCIFFYDEDVKFCLKFIDVMFYINTVVSFIQFFLLGYKWDYLGGIFGTETGCNASSLILFTIVVAKSVLQYMNKQEKLWLCVFKCLLTLVLAAMAELKFYFVVFVVVLILAALFTTMSFRKLFIIITASVLLLFASGLLTILFGESSTLSLERIITLATAENYSSHEDLGRFTAIPTIANTILVNPMDQLFGMGLGNCDTSSFDICNTPFFQTHSDLNYTWFSSAFLFLEVGYVGLAIFLFFFVICFVFAWNTSRKPESNKIHCQLSMIICVFCVMLTFYNCSLRLESAYLIYFVLALPLIGSKSDIDYQRRLNVHT